MRVHFSVTGCALFGDDIYGGRMDLGIERQVLHCYGLRFYHPFTEELLEFKQPLVTDMEAVVGRLEK